MSEAKASLEESSRKRQAQHGDSQSEQAPKRKRTALGDLTNQLHEDQPKERHSKPRAVAEEEDDEVEDEDEEQEDEEQVEGARSKGPSGHRVDALDSSLFQSSVPESNHAHDEEDKRKADAQSRARNQQEEDNGAVDEGSNIGAALSLFDENAQSGFPEPVEATRRLASSPDNLHSHLKLEQAQFMPNVHYMNRQPFLSEHMRAILVDWLVEVGDEFGLSLAALFLSVSVLDRYLERQVVTQDKLQLVGITSMLVASKVEQGAQPSVNELVLISDNSYAPGQITELEVILLNTIQFKVLAPTTHSFLSRYQKAAVADEEAVQLSDFLATLTLLEMEFLRFEPSKIAASALAIALYALECVPWTVALEESSGYRLIDLGECMEEVLRVFTDAPAFPLQGVRDKYSQPNPHLCVASIHPPGSVPVM